MLRLLILFLILRGAAATSEDTEGNSSGDISDDEDGDDVGNTRRFVNAGNELPAASPGSDKSKSQTDDEADGGGTLVIIIAAVSVVVLVIGGIIAIVLFRRYLQSREQGVYSVPAEQGQKAAV